MNNPILVVVLTWKSIIVGISAAIAAYCLLLVAYSYSNHPAIAHWLHGSEDYRRWKEEQ